LKNKKFWSSKKNIDRIQDNYDDLDYEEKPLVTHIILPTKLWLKALEEGRKTSNEVGFFIIGLFKGKICYVYNLIEFDYIEQSGAFIESGVKRLARIRAGLPVGLKIVGNMHKHPGFLGYSGTDKRDYLKYGAMSSQNAFLIYIVEPYDGIAGYTATESKIHKIEVDIRDLDPDEMLIEKNISLQVNFPMVVQKSDYIKSIRFKLIDQLSSEILKNFSRGNLVDNDDFILPGMLTGAEISDNLKLNPKIPLFIKNIGINKEMIFRIFMEPENTLNDLKEILLDMTKISDYDISKIQFYENNKLVPSYTKISKINSVLDWKIGLLPLKKFKLIFFKDLFDIIINYYISIIYKWVD